MAEEGAGAAIARRIVVSGWVQGVGFRWATARLAQQLGLSGTVRNLPDGTVEIVVRGGELSIDALRSALSDRMPGRVEAVAAAALPSEAAAQIERGFRIVR